MAVKAIFLDKDGTLIEDVPYNVDPSRIALYRGAARALRKLARQDYRFFVVSNQPGVGHGLFSEAALRSAGQRVAELLAQEQLRLDGFYYCPHHPGAALPHYALACECRKPAPGLLLRAAAEHDIDLGASWMIGDILHDVEAGKRAGCRTLLLDNGNETEWHLYGPRLPDLIAPGWGSVASLIAHADRAQGVKR